MSRTFDRLNVQTPHAPGLDVPWTTSDSVFRMLVVVALCLEIVVFVEPAPVDVAIILGLGLGLFLRKLDFSAVGTLPLVSLVAFALANLASMYDPADMDRAVWYVLVTLYLIGSWFFFVGLIGHYREPMMATLVNTYSFAGLISALLGIGGYFNVLPFQSASLLAGRAQGLFKDPNVYGPYFVPVALFALTRIMDGIATWRAKLYWIVLFLSSVLAILLCFSRACWLNFAVSLPIFLIAKHVFVKPQRTSRQNPVVAAAVLAGTALFLVFLIDTPTVQQMMAQRVTGSGLQGYDRVRFATQSLALEAAAHRPLGIGPGQSELVFAYATHSMYMRILSENGLIALIAMLLFIGATAARAISVARTAETRWVRNVNVVVLACIVGHLVNSAVIDTVHWRHIWFIFALPWAPLRVREYSSHLRVRRSPSRRRAPLLTVPKFVGE